MSEGAIASRHELQRGAPAYGGAGFGEARSRGPAEWGCAPDPVREAPVREGAHKAAIDICETGRNASAPANGPSANGSQPPPDPVRVAPVREGAHKAAIGIGETGRNASAPANGPSANGSQPPPVAGCLRTGINAGLCTPTRSHPQRSPCSALRCAHVARRIVTKYEVNSSHLLSPFTVSLNTVPL
jgi:hypothetical protein